MKDLSTIARWVRSLLEVTKSGDKRTSIPSIQTSDGIDDPAQVPIPENRFTSPQGTSGVRKRVLKVLRGGAGLLSLVLVWAAFSQFVGGGLPSPGAAVAALVHNVQSGRLPIYIGNSLQTLAIGCVSAALVGIPAGILIGRSAIAYRLTAPLISFLQAVSGIAWIPMFLVWTGFSRTTIVILINYVVLFPIIGNTSTGIRTIPQQYVHAAQTLGASRTQLLLDVFLPGALPNIITGLRTAVAFGWRALIVAEMIVSAEGLGYLIFDARNQGAISTVVAGMVTIGLLWLFLDRMIFRPVEESTVQRWGILT